MQHLSCFVYLYNLNGFTSMPETTCLWIRRVLPILKVLGKVKSALERRVPISLLLFVLVIGGRAWRHLRLRPDNDIYYFILLLLLLFGSTEWRLLGFRPYGRVCHYILFFSSMEWWRFGLRPGKTVFFFLFVFQFLFVCFATYTLMWFLCACRKKSV